MQSQATVVPRAEIPPVSRNELYDILMLFRASTLKMIRLQLAIERHDRRVAIQAVDDLVALDRRMQDYLATVSAPGDQLLFQRDVEHDRAMLNAEKLTLTAEVLRRPEIAIHAQPQAAEAEWIHAGEWLPSEVEPRRRHWFFLIPIFATAVAAAAYFAELPVLQQWLSAGGFG